MKRSYLTAVFVSCALLAAPASSQDVGFELHGTFLSILHYRSDSDFDPTERWYDPDGQSEGQAATYLVPELGLRIGTDLRLLYQSELGWNIWSRNDPDRPNQFLPADQLGLAYRHKQLFAEWQASDVVGIRFGYQAFADPSRVFMDHIFGAARVNITAGKVLATAWVGQLPETTYEGVEIRDDNFVTDSFVAGSQVAIPAGPVEVDVGGVFVADLRDIDRPFYLGTLVAGVRWKAKGIDVYGHLLGQAGQWAGSGAGGVDQLILAWAAQAGVRHEVGKIRWSANVLALSGDDDHDGNDLWGAFFTSGKNHSPTTLLTEDETRDRYDNFDEQLGTPHGAFVYNRAGLVVADASFGYQVTSFYVPSLVAGVAFDTNPENALGNRYAGLELTLRNDFPVSDHVFFVLNAQVFLPGEALSVFVNDIDGAATRPMWGLQGGMGAKL